jgi:rhodanese-related sulfurtransferase
VAQTLLDDGFKKVKALIGGFDAWERAGYPVELKDKNSR